MIVHTESELTGADNYPQVFYNLVDRGAVS
jgi:hypothetical protein